MIQESFINMENMLDLMSEPEEVRDSPEALPIRAERGRIEFRSVGFHYAPERRILKDISFVANPGETVALVTGHFPYIVIDYFEKYFESCRLAPLVPGRAPSSGCSSGSRTYR